MVSNTRSRRHNLKANSRRTGAGAGGLYVSRCSNSTMAQRVNAQTSAVCGVISSRIAPVT